MQTKSRVHRKPNFKIQGFKKQSFCFDSNCNFDGVYKMNIFNILFTHATKNYEVNVSINVNKLRLENTTAKLELIQN